jgi:hypothetical protein
MLLLRLFFFVWGGILCCHAHALDGPKLNGTHAAQRLVLTSETHFHSHDMGKQSERRFGFTMDTWVRYFSI